MHAKYLSIRAVKTQLQIVLIRLFAATDGYPISVKNELKKFFLKKIREILSHVTNNHLESDSSAWEQATLPVGLGGLGIRSTVDVAPSAYLASIHSAAQLIEAILPESHQTIPTPHVDEAKARWSAGHESEAPEDTAACLQRAWDSVRIMSTSQRLLDNAMDEEECARLLAVTTRESGAWLRALPVTALVLRMDGLKMSQQSREISPVHGY